MKTAIRILSVVALAAVASTAASIVAFRVLPQGIYLGVPPRELRGALKGVSALEHGDVTGFVSYDTENKRINIAWRYGSSSSPLDIICFESQMISTAYWPTDVCVLSNARWIVSGKARNGATVIEQWLFENGGSVPPPEEYILASNPDQVQWSWQLPVRSSVEEIYRDKIVGQDMVKKVFPNPADQSKVFVYFYDSKDICSLSTTTYELTKVVSPTDTTAPLLVPRLAERHDSFFTAEHTTHGYVFVFKKWSTGFELEGPTLVLLDSNKDGSIDGSLDVSANAWAASDEWSGDASYVRYFPQ